MQNKNCKDFFQKIREIAEKIKDGANFVDAIYINNFEEKIRRATEHADSIVNTNRDLKIGIVGQVKAGKSSFLNAMRFDGRDFCQKLPHL